MKCRNVLRRVLAAALCLCVCLGLVEMALPALASEGGGVAQTEIWIYHEYLNTSDKNYSGSIASDGTGSVGVSNDPKDIFVAEDGVITITPQPIMDGAGNEVESFSGFSVENGDAAVTIDTSDPDAPKATIRYESSTPLVILHVYYHYNVSHFSANFSAGDASDVLPDEQDVVVVDDTNLAEIQKIDGLSGVSVGDKVYNTAMGLHTEAYAEVAATTSKNYSDLNTPLNDGRTFDVTLESWFAQNNPTDVGFILDASGSMAFLDDDVDKGTGVFSRGERDKDYDFEPTWIEYAGGGSDYNEVYEEVYKQYGEFVLLPQDAVNKLLNPSYTDNTSLAYNDYQYYVYDRRDTVRELVPLGYWDGNTGGTENPLEKNLVGLYQFDRSGSGEPDFLKNGAPGGSAAEITKDNKHHKTGDSADGIEKAGAFQLYSAESGSDPAAGAVVQLDATVSDPSAFTISFAVKTNGTGKINEKYGKKENGGTGTGPQAQDLVTIKSGGTTLYTILRGTKGVGDSQNHVRWQNDEKNQYVNLSGALGKANNKTWYVFTYVVSGGTVTAYVDGKQTTTDTVNLGSGPLSFTLGGDDEFVSGPVVQIDEVYIYDRALGKGEVEDLYSVSTSTKTVFDAVGAGEYAHFDSTGADMLISDRDSVTLPSQTKLAGWYYVNSTGNYDNIMAAGSAKSLHFLGTVGDSTEKYPTPPQTVDIPKDSEGNIITDSRGYIDWDQAVPYSTNLYATVEDRDKKQNSISGQTITDITPCRFYFARLADDSYDAYPYGEKGRVVLRCIFSPAKGMVEDEPVIVEQVGYHIQNKHKMLDNALNRFIQQLRTAAPGSRLSAVRFSSDSFESHTDQLLMQNWTDSETASTGLMSLNRGEDTGGGHAKAGSYDTVQDDAGNNVNLYNYVMTGGTYAYTGLKAFQEQLAGGVRSDAAKYIVLFTDGADDELKGITATDPEDPQIQATKAVTLAKELKKTFTIFVVRLTSGTVVTGTSDAFLKAIASEGSDGKPLYFTASGTDGLASVFEDDVMGKMPFGLHGYSVKQYIDPRFDLVGSWNYNENIIHLGEGGHIQRGADSKYDSDLLTARFVTVEFNGMESRLYYDADAGLYYLQWDNQTIPRSNVGSNNIYTWQCTITLRAKEDFIGGDGLLAQGPGTMQNYVFDPDDSSPSSGTDRAANTANLLPSKGFPRIQLNVQPYSMATVPMVDVRYVGESTDPAAALKALFESAEGEIGDLDHLRHSAHDEPNELEPDGSGYYYEYVRRYINQHPAEYANLDAFLAALLTAADGIELPYYFLPAVGGGTQTGGSSYQADKLGTIKYKWEAVTDGLPSGTNANITDAGPKQYKLTVTFVADKAYKTTVSDGVYNTPRYTVGATSDPAPAEALHTTYVVGGELAVKVRARKEALETYMAGHGGNLVVTVAMKKDGGVSENYELTLTADDLTDLGTGEVELALTDEAFQDLAPGEYTLSLVSTAEQYFTHFSPANTGDYTPESFSEGYIPAGAALSGYIAPAGTTSEANTVVFKLGDLGGAASVEEARADLADTLAKWVDKMLEGHRGDDQAALNALDLDPTWAEQNSDFSLPAYLNARLGMGVGEVTISPPVSVTLKTSKTVVNGENNNTMVGFDFTLTSTDTGAVESTGSVVIPPNSADPAAASLAPIKFEHPGTYTYTLAEKNNGLDNFNYSTETYTVEITANADGTAIVRVNGTSVDFEADGSDAASHTYTYDLAKAGAVFANTYAAPPAPDAIYVNLGAAKTLDGATAMDADLFTFRLQGEGVNMTAKNTADGHISFAPITYAKAGEYAYTLWEEAGVGNYKYDETHHDVVVTVVEDGGVLQVASILVDGADKTASPTELAVFANETIPVDPGVAYIMGTKVFANGGAGQTFTFKLEAGTASIALPAIMSVPVPDPEASPDAEPQPNEGTPGMDGPTADTPAPEDTPATADTPAPEETPVPTDTPAPTDTPVPTDTPAPEDTAAPAEAVVQPVLLGAAVRPMGVAAMRAPALLSMRTAGEGVPEPGPNAGQTPEGEQTPPAGETTTQPGEGLTETPGGDPSSEDLPANAGGTQPEIMPLDLGVVPMPDVTEDTTDGSGTFSFGPITFTQAGTYTYTVSEVAGSEPGIYYDKTVYTVTFVVTDAGGGELSVGTPTITDAAGGESSSILFLNAAVSKTSGTAGDTVNEGDTLTYDVSWANFSNSSSVTVTDLFDPGVDFKTASFTGAVPTGFSKTGDSYAWHYEGQHPGDAGAIEITVQVNENADEDWRYASGGTLAGETYGESVPTVYNRASVQCGSETMLTSTISNIVLPKSPPVPPTATGSLKVTKTVIGGDAGQDFTFQVHVEDAENETYGDTVFDGAGLTTFTLQDGGSKTISGLPAGKRYQVSETESADYKTTAVNANGTILAGSEAVAAFTNEKVTSPGPGTDPDGPGTDPDGPGGDPGPSGPGSQPGTTTRSGGAVGTAPMTGDDASAAPWLLLLGVSCTGLAMVANRRKRRQR